MGAMRFRHELTYDATPAEVFAMLGDQAFRERVCAAQEVVSADITITRTGDGFRLVTTQVQKTAGLPAIARKFAGDTTEAVVEEAWTGPARAALKITAPGKPTSATGTITLTSAGTRTTELVEVDITVKVPLIGRRLEALMADNIKSGLLVEQTVGTAWLAGER